MIKKSFHFSFKIFIEILLGILILVFIACGFGAWKLSDGPIQIDQAIPFIQDQLNTQSDNKFEIGGLKLEWQGFENPLGIEAQNVKMSNARGPFLFSPEIDINISLRSLLIGKLRIEALWIRRIALSVTRDNEGRINITGQQIKDEVQDEEISAVPATVTLNSLIYDLPDLDVLWIDQAKIIYRDLPNKKTHVFDPATVFIESQKMGDDKKLAGFLTFPFGQETTDNVIKGNFNTISDPASLNVSATFKETPIDSFMPFLPVLPDGYDLNMVVNANVQARLSNIWELENIDLDIAAPRGQIHFPLNGKEDHVDVADLKIHVIEDPKTSELTVNEISAKINDQATVNITGGVLNINEADKVSGNIVVDVKDLPQSWFKKYWPVEVSDNGAYRWLVEKMDGGIFSSIHFETAFDRKMSERTDGKPLPPWLSYARGEFAYDGVTIDYRAPLSPATKTIGTGKYDDVSLTLNIQSSDVGGLNVKDGSLYFDDLLTSGTGWSELKFPVTAKAQDAFDYISLEPIAAFKNIKFKPKDTKGDVKATVDIKILLLKDLPMEDVKVNVEGVLTNAEIPNAVRGLTLSGGPYDITASTRDIAVKGSGEIQGKPITLDWHEYFSKQSAKKYMSKITAKLTANDKIRRAFINDIAKYLKGDVGIDLDYVTDVRGKNTDIDLKLDLTKTAIEVDDFGLKKPYGRTARATLNVDLVNGDLKSISKLKVKGNGISLANGDVDFITRGGDPIVKDIELQNIAFNENRLSVIASEQNGVLKINVTGAFLDARPFLSGKKDEISTKVESVGRASEIGVDVLEMRTSDNETLKNSKAYIRLNKMGSPEQFELDSLLGAQGKSGDLHVRYTPEVADGLTLRVESNNAGETLRAFDLYPYIQGGTLQIAGVPLASGRFGDVRGKARINNFKVSDAPVLLRLINALSFNGDDLKFQRLESDFKWELGDGGDVYTIKNGTTSGAAIALTFDGYVDTQNDDVNVKGTAAPLSALDSFIGKIPLLGQILTGGDAFLAATYSVKGSTKDPSVSVNPLSVLAPGIIRKMLFEGEVKHEDADKDKVPTRTRGQLN